MSDDLAALLASGRLAPPLVDLLTGMAERARHPDHYRRSLFTDLSTYLDHPEWIEPFERGLAEPAALPAISQVAAGLLTAGADEGELRSWLSGYFLDLRSQRREPAEDTVLDLLDHLTGLGPPVLGGGEGVR